MSNSINKSSGGYSAKDVQQGADEHGHGTSKKYLKHQKLQAARRDVAREAARAGVLIKEEKEFRDLYGSTEETLNKVVIDPAGRILSPNDAHSIRKTAIETASRYRRENGQWQKVRCRVYVKDENGQKVLGSDGKPIRKDVSPAAVKIILHDSFSVHPIMSLALAMAVKAGGDVAKEATDFVYKMAIEFVRIFAEHSEAPLLIVPYHSKPLGGHFQPDYTLVNEDGKKTALKKVLHLGKRMLGSYRLHQLGFTGASLDLVTGSQDAEAGLDEAVAQRGSGIDLKICRDLDSFMKRTIQADQFSKLRGIFQGSAERGYAQYLKRKTIALAGPGLALPTPSPESIEELLAQLRCATDRQTKVSQLPQESRRLRECIFHVMNGGSIADIEGLDANEGRLLQDLADRVFPKDKNRESETRDEREQRVQR